MRISPFGSLSLMGLTHQRVEDMIKRKPADGIRITFNIRMEHTPEEIEKIRKEYEWTLGKMSSSEKKITLMSMDGEAFVVDEVVALELKTIKYMIGDDCVLTLSCITGKILAMVIDYCKKHVKTPNNGDGYPVDELKAWDADFLKVDQSTLFNLILAADYLNIKGLLDLASKAFVDMVRGKTPEIILNPPQPPI